LLLIGAAHHAVTQEREWGTLRMMHGLGLSGPRLLLSKWIGSMSAFALLLLPAILVATYLMVWRASGNPIGTDGVSRLALMLLVLGAYYMSVGALTIVLSSLLSSSRIAWLSALTGWVVLVLVVPRAGAAMADRLVALPSGEAFWAAIASDIQRGLPGDGNAAERITAYDAQLLREHSVTRVEELPFSITAQRRLFRDTYAAKVHAVHFTSLWDRFAAQEQIIRLSGVLSPTAPVRQILMSLAGSGLADQRHFEEAAERYRETFTSAIDEWDVRATRGIGNYEAKYAGNEVWSAIPPFQHNPSALPDTVTRIAPDLVCVGVWCFGAIALLLVAGRRLTP
jgi:ABC-2 type transport system permease protein